jgi:DNA-binding MarR family transcriptional regulator
VMEIRMLTMMMAKFWRQSMEQRMQTEGLVLSWLQQGVLRMLQHSGPTTISDMSKMFMCDPSTLVPSIDGLERKGFVVRERDPNDRRRVPVALTGEGRGLITRIEAITDDDPLLLSIEKLGIEQATTMINLMRSIVRNLPEGEGMVQHLEERIASYQANETAESTEKGSM